MGIHISEKQSLHWPAPKHECFHAMMMSSNGNIFRVTGPLCGEFTCHRWIPLTKASDAELWCCFLFRAWIKGWVNSRGAGDLRRHRALGDITVRAHLRLAGVRPPCHPRIQLRSCLHIYRLWLFLSCNPHGWYWIASWLNPHNNLQNGRYPHEERHCCLKVFA